MLKKEEDSILPVVILLFVVLLFGAAQMYLLTNFLILICCVFFYNYNKSLIISLFVVLLSTNGLFSTENNILGFLSPVTISQLFAFGVLIENYERTKSSKYAKISILFILVLFLFNTIYDFRNAYFDIYNLDFNLAFRRLVKNIFRFGSLYLLVKSIDRNQYINIILKSVNVGIIFLIFSSIFTSQLSNLKFLTTDASEEISSFQSIERKSGFFAFGDVNSLGGLLSTYIGFLFVVFSKGKKYLLFLTLVFISILGILYTGSRTAIASLSFVFILFIFVKLPQTKFRYKISLFIGISVTLLILYAFLSKEVGLVFERFNYWDNELDKSHEGTRIYKWLYYLGYIWENLDTLLIGTSKELFLNLGKGFYQARVPHNFYISILFHSGIIIFVIILISWLKLIRLAIKNNTLFFIAIPTFAISFYVSDWGYFQYFILFIPILGVFSKFKKINI